MGYIPPLQEPGTLILTQSDNYSLLLTFGMFVCLADPIFQHYVPTDFLRFSGNLSRNRSRD